MHVIDGQIKALGTSLVSNMRQVYSVVEFVDISGKNRRIGGLRVPAELSMHFHPGVSGRFVMQGVYLLGMKVDGETYIHTSYAMARFWSYNLLLAVLTMGLWIVVLVFSPKIPGDGTVLRALDAADGSI